MSEQNTGLTAAEWNVMECLWESSPRTGRQAVDFLKSSVGWSRSTTLTMLRRMADKGLISCDEKDGVKVYAPLLKRGETVMRETDDFLNRIYKGSVSMMMSAITQKQKLSKEEIQELYAILDRAGEGRQ
ncbi:MAG: BlaI/MecI/CopY family transcriptional regulator [Clostridia bacterium]|nr:BlaI/MecI/CopY family transcriptional regulator [Clostridia bacterium]